MQKVPQIASSESLAGVAWQGMLGFSSKLDVHCQAKEGVYQEDFEDE